MEAKKRGTLLRISSQATKHHTTRDQHSAPQPQPRHTTPSLPSPSSPSNDAVQPSNDADVPSNDAGGAFKWRGPGSLRAGSGPAEELTEGDPGPRRFKALTASIEGKSASFEGCAAPFEGDGSGVGFAAASSLQCSPPLPAPGSAQPAP